MEKVKDFVCGTEIETDKCAGSFDWEGKTYHFCSDSCKESFSKNPGSYIQ